MGESCRQVASIILGSVAVETQVPDGGMIQGFLRPLSRAFPRATGKKNSAIERLKTQENPPRALQGDIMTPARMHRLDGPRHAVIWGGLPRPRGTRSRAGELGSAPDWCRGRMGLVISSPAPFENGENDVGPVVMTRWRSLHRAARIPFLAVSWDAFDGGGTAPREKCQGMI